MERIAILWLPGRGKRNEFVPLLEDERKQAEWVKPEAYWTHFPDGADLIIIPGSQATTADMQHLRELGFDEVILKHVAGGGKVVGICAGYQMLGQKLHDPLWTQGGASEVDGLGLLPVSTLFGPKMLTCRTKATSNILPRAQISITGEERRSGYTWLTNRSKRFRSFAAIQSREVVDEDRPPARSRSLMPGKIWAPGREKFDGVFRSDGLVLGTYLHNVFHHELFREAILGCENGRMD